jgi:hypothetical protein
VRQKAERGIEKLKKRVEKENKLKENKETKQR